MTIQDREKVAARLLRASERLSYDPVTDIDWDQPLDPTLFAIPEHRVSLYGTEMWERMPHEQRVALSCTSSPASAASGCGSRSS